MEERDPFEIIGEVPKGKTYQWVAISVAGSEAAAAYARSKMEAGGWKPVPAKRHPKMPKRGGRIEYGGCVLMERSVALTEAASAKEQAAAKDMEAAFFGNLGAEHGGRGYVITPAPGGGTYEEAQTAVTVEVAIPLRLPPNLVTAASVCAITPAEYARRVMALILRGGLNYMLLPNEKGDAFELFDRLIVSRPDKGSIYG